MLALLYTLLSFTMGFVLCTFLFPQLSELSETTCRKAPLGISRYYILLPSWYVTGTILITWITYISAYLFRAKAKPLIYGDFISMSFAAIVSLVGIFIILLKKYELPFKRQFARLTSGEVTFIIIACVIILSLMYGTFFVMSGKLYVGVSVFSDFSPHLGMIRSFSHGNNFPTTYSHYAGEDIRYHFMFQFLVGNLEFLGLRLDHAFNMPSALCLLFACFLLYALALRITAKKRVGYLAVLLFAFRSSPSFFTYAASLQKNTVWKSLVENTSFIGYTTHEDWGLWNLNVYCNQRHLAIGICVLLILVHLFIGNLYDMAERWKTFAAERDERETEKLLALEAEQQAAFESATAESDEISEEEEIEEYVPKKRTRLDKILGDLSDYIIFSFCSKEGWLPKRILIPVAAGLLLGAAAFWNGAAVLATIMVLFVFAMVADRRLEYLITAVLAGGLSIAQTKFFTEGESVVSTKFQYGFIAENPTFFGTLDYVWRLCGVLIPVLFIAFVVVKGVKKWVLVAFSAPFLFSFYVSLTTDVTVNHKYIMISIMLMNIFAAILLDRMYSNKNGWIKATATLLLILLTITGFYDYTVVLKKNNALNGCLTYSMNDPMADWIEENTTSQDVFLTSHYALSRAVLAGAMLYEGHAYYPLTAGYDTNKRYALSKTMFECTDRDKLIQLIQENGITYVIIDNEARTSGDFKLNEAIFDSTFEKVYTEDSGQWMISIYDTSKIIEN